MPSFQVHDTVALRKDHTFIGAIERTSLFDSEPLDDCLIIAHTEVPAHTIQDFVRTGTPPSGFVFVQFAQQEKGSSLVAENDLILIDRIFDVGDVVRQETSQMLGTVTNVNSSYVLDPVWLPHLTNNGFDAKPANNRASHIPHACNDSCDPLQPWTAHPHPERLIADVPFEELKRAQDFMEGDYVIASDWLGMVDAVELCVVIKLENNTVVMVSEPDELFIPIPDYDRPLVPLSDYDGLPRPHYVSAMQGWGSTIPPEDLECGQFVVTNHKNLRSGRWLQGQYDPRARPEGHVLMVRCRDLSIHWLMCNAFATEAKTPSLTKPYENLETCTEAREIRRDRRLVLYDPSKPSPHVVDRTRLAAGTDKEQMKTKNTSSINLSSHFSVGERVKFREAAGAAVKYQGRENHAIRNSFRRIQPNETLGYDLNEFELVQSQQTATVRWQDGSISAYPSTTLYKTTLFEADLMPSDVVVAKEGMKQRRRAGPEENPAIQYQLMDFNEMTFFEHPHDLLPAKVGIIQHMDPRERLVTVRWYTAPSVRIAYSGNALGSESRFGPIGNDVEDLSTYEVMSFPCLVRKLRDIVTFTPNCIPMKAIQAMKDIKMRDFLEVSACITALSQIPDRQPKALLEYMQHIACKSLDENTIRHVVDDAHDRPHHRTDWAAEICQLRTDGLVIVRANFGEAASDIVLEHDQILSFVDDTYWGIDHSSDPMDLGSDSDESDGSDITQDIISEEVLYEGGERLDNDAGDENWESEDETDQNESTRRNSFVMVDPTPAAAEILPEPPTLATHRQTIETEPSESVTSGIRSLLAPFLGPVEPSAFLSLDHSPPADQFRVSQSPSTSASFLKRIAKEHRALANGLPRREIYVRTYDSRLDLLRCLIVGPLDTPYECAPFLIDLHLGATFPREPPTAHFHSWTSGMGRVNPNLYEEGKICLSLLGTWPGKSETEGWTEKSTLLQLLVSLQGLVFVKEPFYNEAGYEGAEGYSRESLQYSEKAYVMARNFLKHALKSPIGALEDVLAWLYLPKNKHKGQLDALYNDESAMLKTVIKRGRALIDRSEDLKGPSKQLGGEDEDDDERLLSGDGKSGDATKTFLRPLSRGAFVMLNRTLRTLDDILCTEIKAIADSSPTKDSVHQPSAIADAH